MKAILTWLGYSPQAIEPHSYRVFAESGESWTMAESEFYKTGTEITLPDYMGQVGSGWVHWYCDSCHADFWTRGSPGSPIQCTCCGVMDTIPEDAHMLRYQGVDYEYIDDEED